MSYYMDQRPFPQTMFAHDAEPSFFSIIQRAGGGIKLRFLVAIVITALFPVGLFVLLVRPDRFFGRNIWVILAGILLAAVLVAIAVALPIMRSIRRATRDISATTREVQQLSGHARHLAQEHFLGTSILNNTQRRLQSRSTPVVRDSEVIIKTCVALFPRLQHLALHLSSSSDIQMQMIVGDCQQGIQQITQTASHLVSAFEQDSLTDQLGKAITSAYEISAQFKTASERLEEEAVQLQQAADTLI